MRNKFNNYYLVLAVAVLAYVLIARLVRSHFGRAMRGLMENETLAISVGIDVTRTLTLAAVISAAVAGAAGSLYAHYIRIIDPEVFAFINTVTMVIMVISGGKGSLAGPVVGGLVFGLLPVVLPAEEDFAKDVGVVNIAANDFEFDALGDQLSRV